MDGGRTVITTLDAAHCDHHDIHQEMFPIPRMPRVGERSKYEPIVSMFTKFVAMRHILAGGKRALSRSAIAPMCEHR